ncbi:GspE/PulE family protein [Desulfatirhabdium butyrativorans]|uniref:GspE/PulE family protein n=1 Tax=Desulfatirhabdium butyrativorans TaxID=340467 RepID=UPI00040065BF|nr:ATPase, T2SS/T4P/T4SS family [Desulfatirhabdium butyrativorans]
MLLQLPLLNLLKERFSGKPSESAAEPLPVFDPAALGIETIEESGFPESPPATNPFSVAYMKRFRFVPIGETDDTVTVAMAAPLDWISREVIERTYAKRVDVVAAAEETISQFVYRWYEAEVDMGSGEAMDGEASLEDQLWDNPEHLKDMASEAPVIRLVNHIIAKALELGASDVHIEPRKTHVQVRYRVDGVLIDQNAIALKLKAAISSRVKLMSKMDIAEMRLPQDGRIKFKAGREEIDIRVSSLPTHFGEALVLRLLHKENVELDMDNLGFPASIRKRFESAIAMPYGMILVTGPTGSGKTTTLYAALNTINSPDRKIVTVEDPIEYQMDGVNQVQVQPNIGLTFAHCLRTFLRQDPDVMLVGEIRDLETAEIAIQAALTGHVVFSTLHTNDAAGAITRLQDMGVERFLIASSLIAVLAQRLVRRVCPQCRKPVSLSVEEREHLASELGMPIGDIDPNYFRGAGCPACAGSGYRGRIGIYELLPIDEAIQREIVKGSDRNQIFRTSLERGMISLRMDGLAKVREGITTYEEVLRVIR